MSTVAKAIVAAIVTGLGAILVVVQAAITDGTVTSEEWGTIGIAVATAVATVAGVYLKANKPVEA